MSQAVRLKRDTPQWIFQSWFSFLLAAVLCAGGIWNLPDARGVQPFLAMGFTFTLFASLALSKCIRDNQEVTVDTPTWIGTCWAAFAIAMGMTGWSMWGMDMPGWGKGFMVIGWFYLVSSSFVLVKCLRDKQEADKYEQQIAPAPVLASRGPGKDD